MLVGSSASVYVNFWVSTFNSDFDITEDEKTQKAVYTFMPFGLGAIFGTFIFGSLLDKYGYRISLYVLLLLISTFSCLLLIENETH